ncbi:MAG: LemA family protein [Proteobacteria bacterium]|nr:LemA family protein [Pseudomonadota bacterium]
MYIALGVIVTGLLVLVGIYNSMVSKRNGVKSGFANIDVELKRRFDLIPNLVETAKRYMGHESSTLTAVVSARSDAMSTLAALRQQPFDEKLLSKLGDAEQRLSQSLFSFKAIAESYPQLKADGTMLKLMGELADTENRIAFSRQNYNDLVMSYNTSLEVFPNVFFAKVFNFSSAPSWVIEKAEEREAPKVSFG